MWPFKKKPSIPFKEQVKSYPPAPCGEQFNHYFWTEIQSFPCPVCRSIERHKEEAIEEDRKLDLLAEKVAKKLSKYLHTHG